jgi:hypothetical protein
MPAVLPTLFTFEAMENARCMARLHLVEHWTSMATSRLRTSQRLPRSSPIGTATGLTTSRTTTPSRRNGPRSDGTSRWSPGSLGTPSPTAVAAALSATEQVRHLTAETEPASLRASPTPTESRPRTPSGTERCGYHERRAGGTVAESSSG